MIFPKTDNNLFHQGCIYVYWKLFLSFAIETVFDLVLVFTSLNFGCYFLTPTNSDVF